MNGKNPYVLECCVESVESAMQAKKGGADRLELCSGLAIGGLTPSLSLYERIRETVDIRIHVLIRPRFGDFLYSEEEKRVMEKEMDRFRKAGADGVVIGCLSADGCLDTVSMGRLMERAGSMHVTLHRAFDMCKDPFRTLEEAKSLGIRTVLTSGQQSSCRKGMDLLGQLQEQAGDALTVMAGAGVNADTVRAFLLKTSLTAFHMSGKKVLASGMSFRNPDVSMGLPGLSEYELWQTDWEEVAAVRKLLDE